MMAGYAIWFVKHPKYCASDEWCPKVACSKFGLVCLDVILIFNTLLDVGDSVGIILTKGRFPTSEYNNMSARKFEPHEC